MAKPVDGSSAVVLYPAIARPGANPYEPNLRHREDIRPARSPGITLKGVEIVEKHIYGHS